LGDLIPLKEVIYEIKASDGTWCCLPYPNHTGKHGEPMGCKNFPQCPAKFPDFKTIEKKYNWFAVMVDFDRKKFGEEMRAKHIGMSESQSICLLYWQPELRKQLREKAYRNANKFRGDIVLEIPEACGINVMVTMIKAGIIMEVSRPKIVRKFMFIGKPKIQNQNVFKLNQTNKLSPTGVATA